MENNDTDTATEAGRRSVGPLTVGVTLVGVAVVAALLVPLDAVVRSWTVGVLLVLLVLGALGSAFTERLDLARMSRPVRVALQTVPFWGGMSGVMFVLPVFGGLEPGTCVVRGTIAALVFGAGIWAFDRWTGERRRA